MAELEEEKGKTEGSYDSDAGSCTVEREIDFVFDDYVAKFARTDVLKWFLFIFSLIFIGILKISFNFCKS